MDRFEYKTAVLKFTKWGRAEEDYLEIINEYGEQGWKFIGFTPGHLRPKGIKVKGLEMIFERKIPSSDL